MSTVSTTTILLALAGIIISTQSKSQTKKKLPENDRGGGSHMAVIRNDAKAPVTVVIIQESVVAPEVRQGEEIVVKPGESAEVYGYWMTITTSRNDGARVRLCYPLTEGKYRIGVNPSIAAWDFYPTKEAQ
jgi:hypothetical protein